MSNLKMIERKINKIYRMEKGNIYSQSFFQDFSTGFSFSLGEKNTSHRDFFRFEPKNCESERLLRAKTYHDLSYSLEQTIDGAIYSLIAYGKAYIYINPKFTSVIEAKNVKVDKKEIVALEIGEIKGIIKRRNKKNVFYAKGFSGGVMERELFDPGLVTLNINDLGYKKNYFNKIVRKLGKHDITDSTMMLSDNLEGYDFGVHLRKNKIDTLKILKGIGWTFGTDGLSDSYILYKKILKDKYQINVLEYILTKINEGLIRCLSDKSVGKIETNIKYVDYDKVWEQYQKGELTVTELTDLLYKK